MLAYAGRRTIWLSNKETNKVVKLLAGTAGALTLAAALQAIGVITVGGAAATGIAAALAGFGGAALDMCNWNDKGVSIKIIKIGWGVVCLPR